MRHMNVNYCLGKMKHGDNKPTRILRNQFILLSIVLGLFILFSTPVYPSAEPLKVFVLPISGEVDPGMAAFVKRALEEKGNDPKALYIIEMNTFGGRVDSALNIVDSISNIPKGKTIAFVTKKAISAGALIALSANQLAMKNNTTIGDCAPITMSKEGPKMLGEKFQSPLRAKFRALAKKNNYPIQLAESMVSMDKEIYQVTRGGKTTYLDEKEYADLTDQEKSKITKKQTIVAKGELLTMDDSEALKYGFSQASVSSIEQMLDQLGYKNYQIFRITEAWSETLVRYLGAVSQILMILGFAALYMEYKTPGFGIPGIVGLICLGLVFFGQHLVGLANYTEGFLLLIGIVLLGFEIFVIPGFGIAGISGISLILVTMVLIFQDFVIPTPTLPWQMNILVKNMTQVAITFGLGLVVVFIILRFGLMKLSSTGKGPYLMKTLKDSHVKSQEISGIVLGNLGIAQSFLRPSGKIIVGHKRVDAISQGGFIEKGTRVKVIKIENNTIIVCPHLKEK